MNFLIIFTLIAGIGAMITKRFIQEREESLVKSPCYAMYAVEGDGPSQSSEESRERVSESAAGQENQEQNDNPNPGLETQTLLFNALTEIGCQPAIKPEGGIEVAYQGENFQIDVGKVYARFWDPGWCVASMNDPNWPTLREAINRANYDFGPTVVYTSPNEEGNMLIHSLYDIIVVDTIPNLPGYILSVLHSLFQSKENVRNHIYQLRLEQQELHSDRRPVGFVPEPDETE